MLDITTQKVREAGLTDRVELRRGDATADEAFRESLRRATIAAEPLVLPTDEEPHDTGCGGPATGHARTR